MWYFNTRKLTLIIKHFQILLRQRLKTPLVNQTALTTNILKLFIQ